MSDLSPAIIAVKGPVLAALKAAESFIIDGVNAGHIDVSKLNDQEREILPTLSNAIKKMREVGHE